MSRLKLLLLLLGLLCLLPLRMSQAQDADEALAPPEIPGEAIYVPFPVSITLDGDTADWAGVPRTVVSKGTMTSADPAENGSFSVALAADSSNLYLLLTMPDQTIITGQHGSNFWNEDSLEFFLNLSGDLNTTAYGEGIFQVNVNPGDIGNSDPAALTLTGTQSGASGTQGFVFATEEGWGAELAVPLGDWLRPEHGAEIGFQAQANGASELDRNVKLIWSVWDTSDNSWQDPSLFGRALFYELGQTDVPQPSPRVEAVEEEAAPSLQVSVNQVGYLPDMPKYAMLARNLRARMVWTLRDAASGEVVASGLTAPAVEDAAAGTWVHQVDFSSVTRSGDYTLMVDNLQSPVFRIGQDIYHQLPQDALRFFYLNRSGMALEEAYAGEWARAAGHLSDNDVTCFAGEDADGKSWEGCDYRLDASGGWYDAGDYGKYVVNGGISAWTLLNLYERLPDAFPDGSLNIPESGNGVPDILDEVRWELRFLLGMQVPQGQPLAGMAFHKLHELHWAGIPFMPEESVDNSNPATARYVYGPTTAATLNLAASAAQCARVFADFDADFAARCRSAAENAWAAAQENPNMQLGNTPGEGGGNYPNSELSDEFFWAAAELYLTTGEAQYLEALQSSTHYHVFSGMLPDKTSAMYWGDTAPLGALSLLTHRDRLPDDLREQLGQQVIATADRYLAQIEAEGFRVNVPPAGYIWGSNSGVLNNAIILAAAYDLSDNPAYLQGVVEALDYLLGRNALAFSFVSAYGTNTMQHPHHRFWGNQPSAGFPAPPPGAVAGGPNANLEDPVSQAQLADAAPARVYIDDIGSYSTNEVAINWNAPLTWVSAYVRAVAGE